MKNYLVILIVALTAVMGAAPEVRAADLSAVKARMSERLGKVVALKQSGSVGENNLGYLTARKALSGEEAKMVAAENADRRVVYAAIAAKTKTSVGKVGKTRAASIRKTAPKGTWVQLASGAWKQI